MVVVKKVEGDLIEMIDFDVNFTLNINGSI